MIGIRPAEPGGLPTSTTGFNGAQTIWLTRQVHIHADDAGNAYAFHGVFHGDPSPDGMVQTFEFEGAPGNVSMDTLTLEEHDGKTTVRTNSVYQSVQARDGMVQSGMAEGMNEGYDRLEELLGKLIANS